MWVGGTPGAADGGEVSGTPTYGACPLGHIPEPLQEQGACPVSACLVLVCRELVCQVSACPVSACLELVCPESACPVWCPVAYQVRWCLRDARDIPSGAG